MHKLLIQLDSDKHPSSFDCITARDAGVDHVLGYSNVTVDDVRSLVHGAMFTRGGDMLKNTALFIGGSSVPAGEELLKAATDAFFGPVRVSVMADPNGCNTTAAAAVLKMTRATRVSGERVTIFAGTGPVGMRAATLLAKEGALVTITSRSQAKAEQVAESIQQRFGFTVTPRAACDDQATAQALDGAVAVLAAGAAGIQLVPKALWAASPTLKVVADINAVPPLGIEGIKAGDDGKEREGKLAFGALGIGGLKMKIHRAAVARLFEQNDLVLDVEEIYTIGQAL